MQPGVYSCPHCGRQLHVGVPPPAPKNEHNAAAAGAVGGALIGAAVGGPPGAIIGGLIGLLLGNQTDQQGGRR
ncbi:MAG: hypothetical protein JNK70_07075 [Phycisphaerae bacterium]|nr:hypothetical protein [Phycisphaerae bacterium]